MQVLIDLMSITNSLSKTPPPARPDVLELITGSAARADVLSALFAGPVRRWAPNELGRLAGHPHQNVRRELHRLAAAGLVHVTPIDGRRLYEPATDDPVVRDLARFVHQTRGRVPDIRRSLEAEKAPSLAWLLTDTSQAKALVVLSAIPKRIVHTKISRLAGGHVALHPMSVGEWVTRLQKGETFVRYARRAPKLWVIGSGEELIRWEQRCESARTTLARAVQDWRTELSDEWDEDWDPSAQGKAAL